MNFKNISGKILNEHYTGKNTYKVLIIIFGLIYLTIAFCNHYFFRTWTWDYGSYNFAFYDYAHFRISESPVLGEHLSFLQDHVSFTFFIFIPIYWLLTWITGTYTLTLVQVFFVLYGGWAVYKLIEFKTSDRLLSNLALFQYFILYGRWASFSTACNIAIIASSMIPVFLLYFEKRKYLKTLLVFIFILLSREDMSLWTFFIGIFLLIDHIKDKKYRLASLITIATSIGYFILVFTIIIPLIEASYTKFSLFNYSALGKGPAEAFIFIIGHPLKAIELLFINNSGNPAFENVKFEFYYVYILFGGFLLLYRPKFLILFIPLIAKKMLNDNPIRWSIESYYSIEVVTILPIAVFLILYEVKNKLIRILLITFICVSSIAVTGFKLLEKDRVLNYDNTNFAFYKKSMFESGFDVKKVNNYLKLIPSDAKISSSGTINPHLSFRPINYYFPRVEDAEYIAVFTDRNTFPLSQDKFNSELNYYLRSPKWKVLINDLPLLILKKDENNKLSLEQLPAEFTNFYCDAETLNPDSNFLATTNGTTNIDGFLQSNEKFHSGSHSIKLTKEFSYGMIVKIENVEAGDEFEVQAWRYPSNSNSFIVANSFFGDKFYNAESKTERVEENGWELLKKTFTIPVAMHDQGLAIYFWNAGSDSVFFDDIEIKVETKFMERR